MEVLAKVFVCFRSLYLLVLQSQRVKSGKDKVPERSPMMEGGMQLLNRDGHSISHNSKRHYHDSFVSMNRMRQRGVLCDIVLHVGAKEIKAHKVVLASCSPYFHAMFTNEMSESRQTHVTLHDIDPQALEQLVQYAYTAEIVVGEGNVQTLLPAASLLQLNGVRDACSKFLLSQLDPSNCLGIRSFADTHSCSDLLKSAHKYVLQHFVEVSKTEEFMLLPLKQSQRVKSGKDKVPERSPMMEGGMQLLNRDGHSISHNSKRHYHDSFVSMNRMRQRGVLCDIVLHVGAKEIKAHKVVLASCSPYFHAMFTNEMSESRQTHVTLHDIDPQALEQLVQYAYTAEIVVGEGNVQTLLPAASLLQLNGVRDACSKFLLSQLDPSNCLGIRSFADTHSCSDLLKSAHKYVLQHFVEVSKTEEFMLLPLKQVLDLISSDNLNVPSEEEVYRAVLCWVKHDIDSRRQHVPRLMKCVRLPLLTRDFLMSHVDTELLVRHHSECKDLLIEALKYHLMPEQRGVLSNSRTRPRRCEGASPVLFAVGGGSLFAIHGDCEAYDTRTDRWHMVASMSTRRARVGVAAIGNKLYAVGGYDGTSDLATVESYDPVTNSWQPEVSMGTRRSCLGVAVLHGLLYAAGGYDGASCLNSAERYDPLTGTWTSIAAMSTRRRYVRVATLDGNLYAVGGYDSSSHLATVEKYDPQTNTWTSIANMLSRRSSAGVAVLEGMLYVAGGNDGTSCLNSVERYNPKTNTWESVAPMNIRSKPFLVQTNTWTSIANMLSRRSSAGVAVLEGMLYVAGGNDGTSCLNSVERYNPKTNTWESVAPMNIRRSTHDLVAMDGWLYAVGGNDGSSSLNSIEKYNPRTNNNGLFRKKYPQEGQVKSNSIVNILCYISPKKDMSTKDLQKIESINWDQKLAYDPNNGWKKSSTSVKNLGKMIFSSPVRFRFLHCQDIHDCYLDLFQTHLHFLSNNFTGLTYQDQYDRLLVLYPATLIILSDEDGGLFYKGKLPLNAITVSTRNNDDKPNTFMIEGKLINPIIVTCLDQCDYQDWLRHLRALDVAVEGPPANVYDVIYTPTEKEPPRDSRASVQSEWGSTGRVQTQNSHSWSQQQQPPPHRDSGRGRSSFNFSIEDHEDQLLSPEYAKPFCYISSRPASTDMQQTRGLSGRSSTQSSNVKSIMEIHPPPASYSVPDRDSYASTEDPLSPVYNMPYSSLQLEHPADDVSKLPLIKSNSWSTPQSSTQNHQSSVLQRYSDMCAPRKPLTPLYDDPYTPNEWLDKDTSLEPECSDNHKQPALSTLDSDYALPRSFKLSTPPLEKRKRSPPLIKQEAQTEPLSRQDCNRDHSKVKLLPAPPALQGRNTEKSYSLENTEISTSRLKGGQNKEPLN
ncbi:UNVERIFIED_CONTAM: hypothetical protein FKN15_046399 [Acipenser sinensis]